MPDNYKICRITTAYPVVHVGNPTKNVDEILSLLDQINIIPNEKPDVIVFPELCMTGYTCGDLLNQTALLDSALEELSRIRSVVEDQLVFVGIPLVVDGVLYNCAVVLNDSKIIGVIPKSYLPNYNEFYEQRWFQPAPLTNKNINLLHTTVPFGTNILFKADNCRELVVGCEICEDVWTTIPPSSFQSLAGATVLVNLSASNETVGKSEYRRELIKNQSARCMAAYAYCSCGPTESTTDLVFGGHCIIAENGKILKESERFKNYEFITADVDLEKLANERRRRPPKSRNPIGDFERIPFYAKRAYQKTFLQLIERNPFVPVNESNLEERFFEIINIQTCALKKRLEKVNPPKVSIGVSGGLDSTLVLLIAVRTFQSLGWDLNRLDAITMPGFGTSGKTKEYAFELARSLKIPLTSIDIRNQCYQLLHDITYKPFGLDIESPDKLDIGLATLPSNAEDVGFENIQARVRTLILMSRGFVLGTGDMSEMAKGFCTYNGDHISMYNINQGVPKTLVKFLVNYIADTDFGNNGQAHHNLKSIVENVISPELLPHRDGVVHSTEAIIGPYDLTDFYKYYFIRHSFAPKKIMFYADRAAFKYDHQELKKWLKDFLVKFFNSQFKRSCNTDGPIVGSVSLSPRGYWRMPSDAEVDIWIKDLEEL